MAEVIRLASNQAKPVRACATCRHLMPDSAPRYKPLDRCGVSYLRAVDERSRDGICGFDGRMWEPHPPRTPGIFERAWRFLFGGY